jgi:iron complex outermembrane receptor protein
MSGTYLRGTFGGEDTEIGVARWGGRIGDWDSSITAQYRADDGFDGVNDHKRLTDLRARGDYQATVADTVSVQMGMTSGEAGVDAPAGEEYFDPFRDRDIRSHYQQLDWNRADEDGSEYRFKFYHQYYDHDDSYAPDISGFPIDPLDPAGEKFPPGTVLPLGLQVATSERYDVEFQHNPTPADSWRMAWGLGGRYDELSSDLMLGDRSRVERFSGRVFGSLEFKPVQNVAIALDVLTELHESHGTETSSRIGANWMASPQRSFRANASQSRRVFNLLERFLDYPLIASDGTNLGQLLISTLGDDFTSEEVVGYELGYTEQWDDLGLLLDVRLFHEELDNSGMGGNNLSGVVVWRDEAGGWDTTGLDLQLDWRPAPDTRLIGAYSYAEIDGRVGDRLDANGNIIRFEAVKDTAPRHTLSLLASHRFDPHWSGSLALYYMDNVRWRGEGSEVESYTRVDLKLARDFGFADTEGQLALIVQNLMDDEYHEFRDPDKNARDGNTFDRRVYLQLSLGFD